MRATVSVPPSWIPDPMCLEPWEEQDEPLATDRHHDEQVYGVQALRDLLQPRGYCVTRDRWLRVDPTNQQRPVQPDLLIAQGVALDPDESTYDPWLFGKAPDVLGEFLSPTTKEADLERKPHWYAQLGVREFFRFDLSGLISGGPVIAGFELTGEKTWRSMPVDAESGVTSRVLGVRFVVREHLRVIDVTTGSSVPSFAEARIMLRQEELARIEAEHARQREAEARHAAEEELKCLRAELERLRQARSD